MDSSSSSSSHTKSKPSRRCLRILLRPWMLLCCAVFFLSLVFGVASLFSPEWAVKKPGVDYVGLLRSCSESFGCFDTSSVWCLQDRTENCQMMKVRLQLVLLFCLLALFLSLSGILFSLPFFAPFILVMGVGISILSTLSYVTAVTLFITINKHFFTFSTYEDPAQLTYGFYFCVAAAAVSLSASLFALKAAHSHLGEIHRQRQEKGV